MCDCNILHCDLNNFFASVECLDHPEWKEVPMAVCGDFEERHGIVLAKNEKAKKYGVKTGDVIWEAQKKCSGIIISKPHFEKYVHYSKEVRNIYEHYTDMVESFGLDECWLDIGGSRRLFGNGEIIAELIREEVKKRTGLTVSVGVSFNKIFAKLGSDMKKPDATTVIRRDDFTQKVWPLCVNELLYVGRATVKKLNSCGIFTIGDLAKASVQSLKGMFGKNGIMLWRFANGLDDSPVQHSGYKELQKSIGRSTTGRKDLESIREIQHVITALCEDVSRRLREQELYAGIITVWMRDKKLTAQTHQQRLVFPTRLSEVMYHEAVKLIADHWDGIPLRSVGVSVSCLQHEEESLQYSFYCDASQYKRWEQKEAGVDCLRRRFGNDIIMRASQMNKLYDLSNGGEHCSFSHIAR